MVGRVQRSREDKDGWEAEDGHFTPEETVSALDLQLALDRGTLAVGAKIAFLELRRVWCGCDKDLNIHTRRRDRLAVQRALPALPVRVVRGRVDRRLVGGDRKSTRLNSSHTEQSRMPSSA